ncbi:MAG: NAD(P)-dependent oxidoreductase [Candidatus Sulfotelmatobacter sp.]
MRLQKRLGKSLRWERAEDRELSADFKESLRRAEGLVTTWDSPRLESDLAELAPRLRIIAHCGGEVKSRFARESFKKITITNAAGPMARATAEMGAAFLLYCARNVDFYRAELRKPSNEIYDRVHLHGSSESLVGRTVAMMGFGRIGRALVELLRGFDVKWMVHDPYAAKSLARKYPVRFVSLEKLLPQARLLVLTAALTDETRGLLSKENLVRLPDGATIINIARGGLIDLAALRSEVASGRLRCAIDVTDPIEPLSIGDPLRNLSGAIVTPHVAGSGRHVREEIAEVVIDDLERFFGGGRVRNRVTAAMLDRMT